VTPHVQILLAVRDGADHLPDQLASYARQTLDTWSLIASDDGSADDSRAAVARFGAAHPGRVAVIDGPRQGYGQNFLHLLRQADAEFAALSDQDDAWFPHHLARAVWRLGDHTDRPALYCARTILCGPDLRPLRPTRLFRGTPSFAHALVQSLAGGHTMVLNRAALSLAQDASAAVEGPIVHDWFLYQLVTGSGGVVIYDPAPALEYRQHGRNQIGGAAAPRHRVARLLEGRFRRWNEVNIRTLQRLRPHLTADAADRLDRFAAARAARTGIGRLRALSRAGVGRQTVPEQIALYLAALAGRI